MRFLRYHDGEALAAVGFGEAHLDFHAEPAGEVSSPARRLARCNPPDATSLEGHTELAAGDLFLQRLDIGVLLEEKGGDARNAPVCPGR